MKQFLKFVIFLSFLILFQHVFAQETAEDKKYIEDTKAWLNAPYEEWNNEVKDDPMLKEDVSGYFKTKVYYLTGSDYKLFFFDGKDCLDKCMPITYCVVMPKDQILEEPYEIQVQSIKNIHQVNNEQKYLIIQKSSFLSGVVPTECASASLLSFKDGKPEFELAFLEGNDDSNNEAVGKAFACSSAFVKKETFMLYDEGSQKLQFRYQAYDELKFFRENKYMDIFGEYKYENGFFRLDYQEVKDVDFGG